MPELLLELFSEEIPARMQAGAAADLQKLVTGALVERGLLYEGAVAHVTPRRLVLHVAGLPARQPDRHEEKKGPRVGAPQGAIDGFLRSAGLSAIGEADVVEDKKGSFYMARIARPGVATLDVLADILPAILKGFPWPKSMRWGAGSTRPDALRWVRPLHSIVATFGPETEEPDIVPFAIDGIRAGNITFGHRFLSPGAIKVRRFDDYLHALQAAKVVVDAGRRRDIILHDARDLAFAQGLELVEDDRLLEEVAGLVEWPRVLMGRFDPAFLAIPPEVVRATIRVNQKCFVLRSGVTLSPRERVVAERPGEGQELSGGLAPHPGPLPAGGEREAPLAPNFILVSNIDASDGGAAIVAGNERVVAARLSDAKFFWDGDLKVPLASRVEKLDAIVFHEKLGTQGERVRRIAALAREIAPLVSADPDLAARTATLAKADLVSEMVGEFPELQGLMGRYYAQAQGEDSQVATAIEDHYRPQGPGDRVPTASVAMAVALADKLDTLVGFWSIGETPTGSKDPYALRRAALGVIRIVVENAVRLRLAPFMREQAHQLLAFFADRLKVYLREKGARHDLIDAAMGAAGEGGTDDLLLIVRRVEALDGLLETDDGKNLLAGYKRAVNILRAEEKKDGANAFAMPADPALFAQDEERALGAAIGRTVGDVAAALDAEDFPAAMRALAALRAPVDAFFDGVTVNADDAAVRANHLRLLGELRAAMHRVADFSKIAA